MRHGPFTLWRNCYEYYKMLYVGYYSKQYSYCNQQYESDSGINILHFDTLGPWLFYMLLCAFLAIRRSPMSTFLSSPTNFSYAVERATQDGEYFTDAILKVRNQST